MYHITEGAVTSGTDLALVPILTGPNGTIAAASSASVYLAQRHIYEVSYQVTAAAQLAGSFTVDPIPVSYTHLVELARLFRVRTDYLLGMEEEQTLSLKGLTSEEIKLLYSLLEYFQRSENDKS